MFSLLERKTMKRILILLVICCLGKFSDTYSQVIIFNTGIEKDADIKVFVTESSSKADLNVCFVDSMKHINNDGLWYNIDFDNMPNKKIYFVNSAEQADLKIYLVDFASQAGWVNPERKKLFMPDK